MRRILYSIHFVSTPDVEMQHDTYLSLRSARGIRLNARFLFGALLFLVSMFLKANTANRWMALPLGLSAFIMISGIWLLSASGRVVFDRTEHKIFCIYKHLGYWQKIYTYQLPSMDAVELSAARLELLRDDGVLIILSKGKPGMEEQLGITARQIASFLQVPLNTVE